MRLRWVGRGAGAVALSRDAHLSDDEAIAKMGHPNPGHPPRGIVALAWVGAGLQPLVLRDDCTLGLRPRL